MAVLPTHALAERYRVAQAQTSSRTAARVLVALRRLLLPARLTDSFPAYLAAASNAVADGREEAAAQAGGFYLATRAAAGVRSAAPAIAPAPIEPARLSTSLLVTGPVTAKRAFARGATVPQAMAAAEVATAGAVYRHTANAGRETIRNTARRDADALGWARVTDGRPCWFCAMLASRGAVYESERTATTTDGGDPYHDGCGCYPFPIFSRNDKVPGLGPELEKLWTKSQKGKPRGVKPADAFREAYEKAYPKDADPGETIAKAQDEAAKPVEDPAWLKEVRELADRVPKDRDGLGTRTATVEDQAAAVEAATLKLRRTREELDAKIATVTSLLDEVDQVRWEYDPKIKPGLAKRLRAAGFSTRGGPDETRNRLQEWLWGEAQTSRGDLEGRIYDAEWDARRAVAVGREGPDLDASGELGEQTDAALTATLDAGRVLDEEIHRRLAEKGLDRDSIAEKIAAADREWVAASDREWEIEVRLIAQAQAIIETPRREWTDAEYDQRDKIVELFKKNSADYQEAAKAKADVRARWREMKANAEGDYKRAFAEAARDALAQVRPMGGKVLTFKAGADPRVVKAMRYAEGNYPTAWLHRAEANEGDWDLSVEDRGYNAVGRRKIVLSEGSTSFSHVTGGPMDGVATHELGHSMEWAFSELRALEWAYHYRRSTEVGEDGVRRLVKAESIYGGDIGMGEELGIRDEWANHYTGKVYGDGGPRGLWEVFTTGVESLFDGSPYFDRKGRVGDDDEFRRFILGVLSVL